MKRILITGALGQVGSELAPYLAKQYGKENVLATSRSEKNRSSIPDLQFELLDVMDPERFRRLVEDNNIDTIIHLAAILSAKGERIPQKTWQTNMDGLYHALEVCRITGAKLFTPSSIAVFDERTQLDDTPQNTVMHPKTIYGITKVAGELLCDYYFNRFGVDARGVRYPGVISYETEPGQGTTDYAVHIYYEAIRKARYTSYLQKGTFLDMIYMPDALRAIVEVMEADPAKLIHRNAYNITSMSLDPEMIASEIKKHIPEFTLDYDVDPVRQKIADSWPNSMDDSCAREEWGWKPEFDLAAMTTDMLEKLRMKL